MLFNLFSLTEGQLPKGAVYVGTNEIVDGDMKHIDTYYMAPSEETVTTVRKIEKKAPKYEGIGPQTGEGMPTGLKTVSHKKLASSGRTPQLQAPLTAMLNSGTSRSYNYHL